MPRTIRRTRSGVGTVAHTLVPAQITANPPTDSVWAFGMTQSHSRQSDIRTPSLSALHPELAAVTLAIRGEYHMVCGETVHSAKQGSQARKSELGKADGACARRSYCVRRAGSEARVDRGELCGL